MLFKWRDEMEKGVLMAITNAVATFEYILMALDCIGFYFLEKFPLRKISMVEIIFRKLINCPVKNDALYCVFIGCYIIVTLAVVIIASCNYWRIRPKEIKNNVNGWKNLKPDHDINLAHQIILMENTIEKNKSKM